MADKTIRALLDKSNNRFAIHDADSGELLHIYAPVRDLSKLNAEQLRDAESEAIRDFIVNGQHAEDEDETEPGW